MQTRFFIAPGFRHRKHLMSMLISIRSGFIVFGCCSFHGEMLYLRYGTYVSSAGVAGLLVLDDCLARRTIFSCSSQVASNSLNSFTALSLTWSGRTRNSTSQSVRQSCVEHRRNRHIVSSEDSTACYQVKIDR
jgi:hypothetical protein